MVSYNCFLSFSVPISINNFPMIYHFKIFLIKRTFAIRFRYLPMNAVALRTVSGS